MCQKRFSTKEHYRVSISWKVRQAMKQRSWMGLPSPHQDVPVVARPLQDADKRADPPCEAYGVPVDLVLNRQHPQGADGVLEAIDVGVPLPAHPNRAMVISIMVTW